MLRYFENSAQRLLSKSGVATKLAVKIRNQANCVIGYHLGESSHPDANGESQLADQLSPHVATFIDVGANVGAWSERILKNQLCKGFMFEPSAQCVKVLRERFGERDVVIRDVAVSDRSGIMDFAEEDNCGETSSLTKARTTDLQTHSRHRDVSVTTLDAEFGRSDLYFDFLKIDTEGFDLKVMQGAVQTLARTRFLQFEYNSYWLLVGSSLYEANEFLHELGFSILAP